MKSPPKPTAASRSLEVELKTLWGARAWPFAAPAPQPYQSAAFTAALDQLHQLLAVRSSGVLCGANGIGKSLLIHTLLEQLPGKSYRSLRLTHSSLSASDLIRQLCRLHGLPAAMRRSDNALALRQLWQELAPLWPVVVVEEAQNLSAQALEELRLLACDRRDTQTPFSLVLVGDDNLLARLQLGVNRPLLSRLGFCLTLAPWPRADAQAYLLYRLQEVGIAADAIESPAEELLLQSTAGIPRLINHLGQRAFEQAAREHARQVSAAHVQQALAQMPWLGNLTRQ